MEALRKIKHAIIPDWLRKKYYTYLSHKHYIECMNMPECEYEDYLCRRYAQMMDRFPETKGLRMDFENPTTYTEKQQWIKLYGYDPKMSEYADKYEVRKHIAKILGGGGYLIPLISINGKDCFTSADEIDFDALPNRFVIKCTHSSHSVIIVKDKSGLSKRDIKKYKKQLNAWLRENYAFKVGLELHYSPIKPRIIIEEYMEIDDDLPDYKFLCFSGNVKYLKYVTGRYTERRTTILDAEWNPMPFYIEKLPLVGNEKKPENFEKMLEISELLSKEFAFVRVDLYNIRGKIYFGELTFSSHAGYAAPYPLEWNQKLGDLIKIDKSVRENNFRYRKH